MALRRISQLDSVLSTLDSQGDPVSEENLSSQVVWFVRNNPLLSGYKMEVSEWNGERPNAPSYYLSKQFDLSTLIAIISANITGSLDEMSTFNNWQYGSDREQHGTSVDLSVSLSAASTIYRAYDHHGINTFENDVVFHRNVVLRGDRTYSPLSSKMTTDKLSRDTDNVVLSVGIPSIFMYPINACAMSAWWADLAEVYDSDGWYPPGTLVQFGGEREITIATTEVNAVITTNPGFILNTGLHKEYTCPTAIAVTGRTPVRVHGKVKKFDRLVLDQNNPGTAIVTEDKNSPQIIAVALESSEDPELKLVLCSTRFRF